MSTGYYVVDKQAKIYYELGKGGWYELHYDLEVFQDLEYLINYILEDCYGGIIEQEIGQETIDYITHQVAPELFTHFGKSNIKDLVVINDSGDDLVIMKSKKYKCVGTRYNVKEGKQIYLEDMNKHLIDNDLNKRLYGQEQYKKYAEWDKY